MIKIYILSLIFATSTYANAIAQDNLNSIYTEAILFVSVFGIMGIISYIYSSRHAKNYIKKDVIIEKEEEERSKYADRIEELSEILKKDLITQGEFNILENYYLNY